MAVLSTVAIRSLEPVADQARFERTQTLLNELRLAIGTSLNPDGPSSSLAHSSYLIDTGEFPSALEDLIVRPNSLAQRALQSFDSDRDSIDDVHLSSGWNGPYFVLGAGQSEILDGWGTAPLLVLNSGSLEIISLGSDGDSVAPEDGYLQDISTTVGLEETVGTLVFRLFAIDGVNGSRIDPAPTGNERLAVLFYGVNSTGGATGEIAEQLIVVPSSGSFEVRREDTLVGQTAARAILWDDADSDLILDVGETIVDKSIVHHPVVRPGIDTRVEMELR